MNFNNKIIKLKCVDKKNSMNFEYLGFKIYYTYYTNNSTKNNEKIFRSCRGFESSCCPINLNIFSI